MTKHVIHRLNDKQVKVFTGPGRLHDGGNLYFYANERGGRSWEYRYEHLTLKGKRRTLGLGGYPEVTLSKARELHKEAAAQWRDGTDPIDARKAGKQTAAASLTVKQACEAYLLAQRARFRTERHVKQMQQRMRDFIFPTIGHLAIANIGRTEVKLCLAPIWQTKHATAKRVRQYLEDILDWSIDEGRRADETNPAEARRLRSALPIGIRKTEHFASLPFEQAPAFFAEIRAQDGVKARALEFIMLTAVRVGDIVGGGKAHSSPMLWSHVDLAEKTWTIPDTKMSKEHTVALSEPALAVLAQMQRYRDPSNDVVFPGAVHGTVISDATLRYLIADMGYKGIATTHGFRATFKTWAEEVMDFDTLVIEAALAHAKKGMAAPYHRGDYLRKRRLLMAAWAEFLEQRTVTHGAAVIAFR